MRATNYGADRDRTGDPLLAKQVLSQLSYRPDVIVLVKLSVERASNERHSVQCPRVTVERSECG